METAIQVFENPQFGQVRTVTREGLPYFVANDVAKALGYSRPKDAVASHCKGGVVLPTPTRGGIQLTKYIPESDVFRLILRSKQSRAEAFQDWVCMEVLPTIRRTGRYEVSHPSVALRPKNPSGRRINRLTPARVADILADVCMVRDDALRERLAAKIKGGVDYGC